MKYRKLLHSKFLARAGQKGQSVVEFVLLLAVMAGITYSFVFFMNKNLSRYWEHAANLIATDDPNSKELKVKK